ncbi:MAG: hypothetical protein V2A73_01355, partial [Pseudomonadota bacterium]
TVLVGLTAAPTTAAAQELQAPRPRQGYYVTLGTHGTVERTSEEGDALELSNGWTTTIRLGQLISNRRGLGLGLLFDFGTASGSDQQQSSMTGIGLAAQVEVAANLALHGAVGFAVLTIDDRREQDDPLRGTYGAAYTVGLTYDWFFTNRQRSGGWAVTPTLFVRWLPGDNISSVAGFLGLELSYWTGLPKNQLSLPDAQAYSR